MSYDETQEIRRISPDETQEIRLQPTLEARITELEEELHRVLMFMKYNILVDIVFIFVLVIFFVI